MIFIAGDTHGNTRGEFRRFNTKRFKEGTSLTKDDFVIICGDTGFLWPNDKESDYWLQWINNKPWTTLYVDGNHCNFNDLYRIPQQERWGGKIRQVADSVWHLGRGEIFTLDGKTVFTFGGAESTDKVYRVQGVSWWQEEVPSYQEFNYGLDNLAKRNNKVDVVITHTAPSSILQMIPMTYRYKDSTANYLEHIMNLITFDKWFCGHMHIDQKIYNVQFLYNDIKKLNDKIR